MSYWQNNKSMLSLNELSKKWSLMTKQFRPKAFWFWNSEMNPDQIKDSVKAMADNDIGEIIIHNTRIRNRIFVRNLI